MTRTPPPFDALEISTQTVLCYTNLHFDLKRAFDVLPVTPLEPGGLTKTKKQRNIDKKKIRAPPGAIISVQYQKYLRGIDLRKPKRCPCPRCKIVNDKGRPVETVSAVYTDAPVDEPGFARARYPTRKWWCSVCERNFASHQLAQKKIDNFLNQTTISMFLDDRKVDGGDEGGGGEDALSSRYLSVMLFKNSLKIAGCKDRNDAVAAMAELWRHLGPAPGVWKLVCEPRPICIFEVVMCNYGFSFGFGINRARLNALLNEEAYRNRVYMSQFEPTNQTNVNIKMLSPKPPGFEYDCLVFPTPDHPEYYTPPARAGPKKGRVRSGEGGAAFAVVDGHAHPACPCPHLAGLDTSQGPARTTVPEIYFKKPCRKAQNAPKCVTLIVFGSSQTIMSGRYPSRIRECYDAFVSIVLANKHRIAEHVGDTV